MGAIIFLAVVAIVFLIAVGSGLAMRSSSDKAVAFGIAGTVFVLFWIVWIFSSVFSVEARSVGIIVEFGKSVGRAGPGIHMASPWSDVTHFSTGNQPLDFDGTDGSGSPIAFKLSGEKDASGIDTSGGEAFANVNITWQVADDDKAINLWNNWKEFDRVKDALVSKNSQSEVAGYMGQYTADQANKGANLSKFSAELKDVLNKRFANDGIRIESVAVMKVDLSGPVQDRMNKKIQDQEDSNRAKLKQATAIIEADTNKIKQSQLTDLVNAANCLEITNNWNDDKNGPLPAGWNCMGSAPFVATNR